jgi:hypothetical protein
MQIYEQVDRVKARREKLRSKLLDESAEFYLYDLLAPGASKDRAERSLWDSSSNFRAWRALGDIIASYD